MYLRTHSQESGPGNPLLRSPSFHLPGLLSTARQLDRENKDEHILEVSNGVNSFTGFKNLLKQSKRKLSQALGPHSTSSTVAEEGAGLRAEEFLKLSLAVRGWW